MDNDNDDITKANDTINNAGHTPTADELKQAPKAVDDAKTTTTKAQGDYQDAQSKANSAQHDVDSANQAVKNDQDALKNLQTPTTPGSVADAQKKVDDDQAQIKKQTKTINDQQQKVDDAQRALDSTKNDHDAATADQKVKQTAADEAHSKVNDTQAALKQAQDALAALNNQGETEVNHIKVNQAYIDAFNKFENAYKSNNNQPSAQSNAASDQLLAIGKQLEQQNNYQHNAADEAVSVDWRNLTPEQRQELSIFAANLINDVRKAFGTKLTVVSPASVEMAQTIVGDYNAKNWDIFGKHMTDGQGHDEDYLNNLWPQNHWVTSENAYSGLEHWTLGDAGGYVKLPIQDQTMDSLKENIYKGICEFLFNDAGISKWGHANNTIGADMTNYDHRDTGVAYDKYGYLHIDEAADFGDTDLNSGAYSLGTSSAADPAQVAAAQKKVNDAKIANDQAQATLKSAQDALKAANNKVETTAAAQTKAQTAVDDAKKALTNDKATLTNLQSQLTKDQQALAAAEEAAKTDADRYGHDTQITEIHVNQGAHGLQPTIANPQVSADGQITVPGQAGLKDLPLGTTVKWHDAAKVAADVMHAGVYLEQVDVLFPDGTQQTVNARLVIVDPNAKATTPAQPGHNAGAAQAANGSAAVNGASATNGAAAAATMTREQYQASQRQNAQKLPQTSGSHDSAILAGLGMMLGFGALLGLRKKQN